MREIQAKIENETRENLLSTSTHSLTSHDSAKPELSKRFKMNNYSYTYNYLDSHCSMFDHNNVNIMSNRTVEFKTIINQHKYFMI